jgi:AraC family transcriptional regulator of arabinose operon
VRSAQVRMIERMSDSARRAGRLSRRQWSNLGAYGNPFSGTGTEFYPLGSKPADAEPVLHEAGYAPKRPHWNYQRVYSPFWRLYYDLERGHSVVFDRRTVVLGPDRMVLIPDHQLFHTSGTEPKAKFWLAFSHLRQPLAEQAIPIQLRPGKAEKALIQDLTQLLWPVRKAVDRERIYHESLALLHVVLSRPEISWQSDTPEGLQKVVRHIEDRYPSPLYIAELARQANMSETIFRKKFKMYRHVSPAEFIRQVRVREAGHLLTTTNLDVAEIAERTGFPNSAYFSRVFRRLTGRTPGRSRQEVMAGAKAKG